MTNSSAHLEPAGDSGTLDQALLAAGLVSKDQLRIVRLEQERRQRPLVTLLVELGFVSEGTLRDTLSQAVGRRSIDLAQVIADTEALARVPFEFARRHRVLPLHFDSRRRVLTIATAEADDSVVIDKLRSLLADGTDVESMLAGAAEIGRAIERYYGHPRSIDSILHELETGEVDLRSMATGADNYSQPIVRLVDALLIDAVKREASDLHFEPEAHFLRIRCRIDGLLRQTHALHKSYWPAMAVRIKVMAGLNIAETRAPQDGRISLDINGHAVDFRVSCLPTLHGENVVLRILDRNKGIVPLDALGLTPPNFDALERMIARPEGLILVTGPTGSGKTTTLYSVLGHINTEDRNIMTLEDPVEYPTPLLRQSSIAEASRLNFADGVRAMLRQDPDVILVGEIRDADTAAMALRAAITGHQVYSTLHTNSAIGALPRLLDLGIRAELLAGNIVGIIAQRLVRKLCPHCLEAVEAEAWTVPLLGLAADGQPATRYRATGCRLCDFQGYRGRVAIMEILRMDAELDELVTRRASQREILAHARNRGFRPLAEDGLRRVRDGSTSLEELLRVIDPGFTGH
ncbi:secretion system protein E [Azoarcus sp. DD4]|uniref:GspE/PulE family protein n=1 Tax=Azoarcus sp. DD4 TaxID=2027405 RepID=UPI001128D0EB|nr:GspE/PulE family protein [Azoarcus sp. DD4]QDF95926.1 secretion system protein E [Azoarcus sp. DD4]